MRILGAGIARFFERCKFVPRVPLESALHSEGDFAREVSCPTVPVSFELGQNYPNPFNPNATIEDALPKAVKVQLRVFNILGQVVKTLVDEEKPVGCHQVVWDGKDEAGRPVSTGVYLYQIKAGDFVETKKMQLVK